ncbi:hypothetical protein LCGC14_1460870 [marine sediment metagenome]|uniref:Uncharacterized protein n=1 Tax=marine sediment metagenome TaxID=412755 RepID=A0A0F9JFP9_9ZZZZ
MERVEVVVTNRVGSNLVILDPCEDGEVKISVSVGGKDVGYVIVAEEGVVVLRAGRERL